MTTETRPDTLWMLDLAQTGAASVIVRIRADQLDLPTPCDEWSVRNVIDKMVASTLVFTSFGLRERPDETLDLVHPIDIIGDDPLGSFEAAALGCREAWRRPGALEGMAPSTIGEAKARAVLNARVFDTTILTWDISRACGLDHGIGDDLAAYVLRIAEALVPAVRSKNPARYKDAVDLGEGADLVAEMVATTGRDPLWSPAPRAS